MSWFRRDLTSDLVLVRILNTKLDKFENFWPIPKGTSYNFYVIKGRNGVVLIDGADYRFSNEFFNALKSIVKPEEIRYIVTQHTEPDHSGTIAELMKIAPDAIILGTKQALSIGEALADFPMDRTREVKDGSELSLGNRTLKFILAPMVHWPDTMLTYLEEESILFTCDLFGSHGANSEVFYDEDPDAFELIDYYASIMMPFDKMVSKAVAKVKEISPKIIAPSHGALYRNIDQIVSIYEKWATWKPSKKALVVIGSQYENTAKMAKAAADGLKEAGLEPIVVDSSDVYYDDLLAYTLEASAILVATATHNGRPFLGVTIYMDLLKEYRPKNKVAAVLGSYSWGGGGTRTVTKEFENLRIPIIEELPFKGKPREEDLVMARELGKKLGGEALRLIGQQQP